MPIQDLTKAELFKYLKANKVALVAEKKLGIKFTDAISIKPVVASREVKTEAVKADGEASPSEVPKDTLDVTVVCNTANFCDSHMDVLTAGSYKESIELKGTSIPHIADHRQSSTSHVGDVTAVYMKELPLRELGLDQEGNTVALLMDTTIRKDYNEDVFKFYKNGKINQHSIGLRYQELKLALNSKVEDDKEEYAVWEEHYPNIVNKDLVDARGYFWAVTKVDVIENSCVLFGANSLTPTLSVKSEIVPTVVPQPSNISIKQEVVPMSDEITVAKYVELQAELETLKKSQTLAVATAVKTETGRCSEILKSAGTFGINSETVMKAVSKGWSLDVVADYFSDLAAKDDSETAIKTGAGSTGSADAVQVAALAAEAAKSNVNSFDKDMELGLSAMKEAPKLFEGLN